ncbi:MAG TPA: Lon-like protease helical domain-containing protein, partial [Burkholderiaceae bacterium]|nr:Lon-like protease helical domain-containing protein [Burkholderiaceae bacterium]
MDTPTTASAGRRLAPEELITRCDVQGLAVALDGDAPSSLVGQRRALDAAELALAMPHEGYHLFISGPPGSGKRTLAQQAIATRVRSAGVRRSDWVYVHNFAQAHRPVALQLPAGRGAQLRRDMRALVDELRSMIPAMFESDEYVGQVERIVAEYKERAEQALEGIAQEAQRRGFAMIRTPVGFTFAPAKDGEVLAPEAFEALSPEQRDTLQRSLQEIQEQLVKVLRTSMRAHKEQVDRVRAATRAMTSMVVEHALDDLLHRYADLPAVHRHLQA